jgi:hypothetical protein
VKPILELSALLKAEARILVVDCALDPAGAYWLRYVSYLAMTAPSLARERTRYWF